MRCLIQVIPNTYLMSEYCSLFLNFCSIDQFLLFNYSISACLLFIAFQAPIACKFTCENSILGAYLIILIYRHLLTIILKWQSSGIYHPNVFCPLVRSHVIYQVRFFIKYDSA